VAKKNKEDKAKKADTKGTKSKADKDEDKAEKAPEFKFGVEDIADELGIKPASVRVQLRNKGIEKAGKSYGWNSKADLKEVIDQLKASAKDSDDGDKKAKGKKDKDAGGKKSKGKKDKSDD
jgi:hypothetical protein